jgi:hypothetical protein
MNVKLKRWYNNWYREGDGPFILAGKEHISSQMRREQAARERLHELDEVRPSGAAPLTEEDLAIFGMFLQQNPEFFSLYTRYAYVDYALFFIAEITKAREEQLEKFT